MATTSHGHHLVDPNVPPSEISIAIMTSGGDAQGMNAAIRAVVRRASVLGVKVYAIYEGYQGMVSGGEMIKHLKWDDVSGLLPKVRSSWSYKAKTGIAWFSQRERRDMGKKLTFSCWVFFSAA